MTGLAGVSISTECFQKNNMLWSESFSVDVPGKVFRMTQWFTNSSGSGVLWLSVLKEMAECSPLLSKATCTAHIVMLGVLGMLWCTSRLPTADDWKLKVDSPAWEAIGRAALLHSCSHRDTAAPSVLTFPLLTISNF